MALIITPKQLNQRAEFYHQLGIMVAAGLTVMKSLEHLELNPPAFSLRGPISKLRAHLAEGNTFAEAVRSLGRWTPSFDCALIDAGERSGRLDACFKLLALYYREQAQMAKQMISSLMYPMFVFNFAIILFPFLDWLKTGNVVRFVAMILAIATPIYGTAFLLVYASQSRHGEKWRSTMERIIRPIPILGTGRFYLALARLSAALEALINAGVPIVSAWELAATASGSPAIGRTVVGWKTALENGSTPAELVTNSRRFPDLFSNLYHTGEVSGKLDETLLRIHTLYQEEGLAKMRAVAEWTPKILYMFVAVFVGWKIISFYSGYFHQLNDVMDMR